jgi:hypothetical protein
MGGMGPYGIYGRNKGSNEGGMFFKAGPKDWTGLEKRIS